MKMSLRNRITMFFLSLLIISTIATIGSVLLATNNSVEKQAQAKLSVGKNVFEQLLYERGNQLLNSATVLVADFGFKDAVTSNDTATIESALINNRIRINADLMLLITLAGEVISSQKEYIIEKKLFKSLLKSAQANNGTSGIVLINEEIFQFVILPVKAPVTLAWTVVATRINQDFAQQLKDLTNLDVIFRAKNQQNNTQAFVSTIKNILPEKSTSIPNDTPIDVILSTQHEQYLTLPVKLANSDFFKINAYLNTSLSESYSLFYPLKIQIISISGITLILSIISAFFIARRISNPIINLANITKEISSGNYKENLYSDHSTHEISRLSKHFNIMQKEIALREDKLKFLAYNDSLTGVANRSLLTKQISDLIINSPKKEFAVVRIYIDQFKEINDTFGYDIGDQLLISFAQVIISYSYQTHYIARLNAAEFSIVLININENTIMEKIIHLQTILQYPLVVNDLKLKNHIIMGIAFHPKQGNEAEQLLRRSEIALNHAKDKNIDYFIYQDGQDERHLRQINLINDLKIALESDELCIHYQAKVDNHKNKVTQAEALLRWIHPKYGFISPEEFINLAEQTGLMPTLTNWVLTQVFVQASKWKKQGLDIVIAVNLSAYDLTIDFPQKIETLLIKHKLKPDSIMLEITESAFMNNPDVALQVLHNLKKIGFSLSIDDYGTGYSSLSQIKNMPIDELKIDKSFVLNLENDKNDQAIVKSTIELAHNIGLSVVAEGVETLQSFSMLKHWGCNKLQGYYISRPISAEDFEAWSKEYKTPEVL
ncbi:MAG: diguanylate cyclase (GGDEF)-like protein [Oceanicoccus sp.]|jgi:diguanylate cyclase (GGDEF)-like protein